MTRNNKKTPILFTTAIAVTSALLYFGYKKYKKYKSIIKAIEIKEEGNKLFKEKEYEKALEKYFKSKEFLEKDDKEYLNILNNISLIYYLRRNFTESLIFTDEYLSIEKKNVKILKRRYDINKLLQNDTEAITDAFILSILDSEKFSSLGKNTLNTVVERQTEEKLENLYIFPGKINVMEFFETFPEISKIYSNSHDLAESKKLEYEDYQRIFTEENSSSSVLFIKASIEHLLGNNEKALDLIKKDIFYYSIILREYISVQFGEMKRSKEFLKLLETQKDDFSVLFYNTLISLQSHDSHYQICLNKGLTLFPKQFTVLKLVFLIQSKDYESVEETIKSVNQYSIPICAIACEYYLMMKKYKEISNLIHEMVLLNESDPRIPLFKGMLKEATDEQDVEKELLNCIELDNTFVKPYILLGNFLMKKNNNDCEKYFQSALEHSHQKDDIDACLRSILLWKVQKMCVEKYPEIFKESKVSD